MVYLDIIIHYQERDISLSTLVATLFVGRKLRTQTIPTPSSSLKAAHEPSQVIDQVVWEKLHWSGIYPPPRHRPKVNLSVLVKEAICL
jgi:hypothetical protein